MRTPIISPIALALIHFTIATLAMAWPLFVEVAFMAQPWGGDGDVDMTFPPIYFLTIGLEHGVSLVLRNCI